MLIHLHACLLPSVLPSFLSFLHNFCLEGFFKLHLSLPIIAWMNGAMNVRSYMAVYKKVKKDNLLADYIVAMMLTFIRNI